MMYTNNLQILNEILFFRQANSHSHTNILQILGKPNYEKLPQQKSFFGHLLK